MAQFVTRLEDALAERIDTLVAAGVFQSRSEAVRVGLEHLVDELEREQIGRQIVEGYTRIPPTPEEIASAHESGRRLIEAEPW